MKQLYINVAGKPVELNPGTVMELEEENPFLQLNDQLKGDYSLPIEVPLTDANKPIFNHLQLLAAPGKIATVENVVVGRRPGADVRHLPEGTVNGKSQSRWYR
jgi:hypothetical protein